MNTVDLAPMSPLILAELAPAITARSVDPSTLDPTLDAAAARSERAATPSLDANVGKSLDAYV